MGDIVLSKLRRRRLGVRIKGRKEAPRERVSAMENENTINVQLEEMAEGIRACR